MKHFVLLPILIFIFFSCNSDNSGSGAYGGKENIVPSPDKNAVEESIKADYNIFIENSGSMNGYVNGSTEFKNALMGIIADIRSRDVARSVNIYYINQTTCPQKLNATTNDIQQFFLNLNPQSFQNSGCGTSTSFLPDIIDKSLVSKPEDVNILISDFIFSDKAGTSQQYLELAKNTLIMNTSEKLKKNNFSSIFVKFNSLYNGRYFIESQRPNVVDVSRRGIHRPYYLLITGKNNALEKLVDNVNFADYSGYANSYFLFIPKGLSPQSKLLRSNKKGAFNIVQPATKMMISNASVAQGENIFQFSFATNLSSLKADNNFVSDKNNYVLSENYHIVSIEKINDKNNESLQGYTHIFTIATQELKQNQDVNIELTSNVPAWIAQSSTINDSNPVDSLQQLQTFGLKYLVDGIAQAYKNAYSDKDQFHVNIHISKNAVDNNSSSSSGFIWWIIIVAAAVIGLFIFLKSRK